MRTFLLFSCLLAFGSISSLADVTKLSCDLKNALVADSLRFHEVNTVVNLPSEVVSLIGDKLADPGQEWDSSDTPSYGVPRERLIWAVTDGEYYVIHYEGGGMGPPRGYFLLAYFKKGEARILFQNSGFESNFKDFLKALDTIDCRITEPSASLVASLTSGAAPLTVKFSGIVQGAGYGFSTGDGSPGHAQACAFRGCVFGNATIPINETCTYFVPGIYIAKLESGNSQSTATITVTGAIPGNGFIVPITTSGAGAEVITFIVVGRGSYTIDTGDSNIVKDRIIDLNGPLQNENPPFRGAAHFYDSIGTRTAKLYTGHPCALDTSCTQSLPAPIATQTITIDNVADRVLKELGIKEVNLDNLNKEIGHGR